jgi:hypothetical protein
MEQVAVSELRDEVHSVVEVCQDQLLQRLELGRLSWLFAGSPSVSKVSWSGSGIYNFPLANCL